MTGGDRLFNDQHGVGPCVGGIVLEKLPVGPAEVWVDTLARRVGCHFFGMQARMLGLLAEQAQAEERAYAFAKQQAEQDRAAEAAAQQETGRAVEAARVEAANTERARAERAREEQERRLAEANLRAQAEVAALVRRAVTPLN